MGYAIISVQKIKTNGAMGAKFNHNFRKADVENADPALKSLNEVLYAEHNPDGSVKTYNESFEDHTKGLKIRKNAVLALEVMTTFTRDANVPLDKWKAENVKFFKDMFNVNPDQNNVVNVVFHGDEIGNVHCHAIVIPVDERGRLTASRFLNGSRAMSEIQDKYSERMKQFGLERGVKGSSAKHTDIRKFYGDIERAKELPDILPGESAKEYRERVRDNIETLQIAALGDRTRKDLELEHELDRKRQIANDNIKEQYCKAQSRIDKALEQRQKDLEDVQREIENMKIVCQNLENSAEDADNRYKKKLREIEDIETLQKKAYSYDYIAKQYNNLDPETAKHVIELLNAQDIVIEPIK